LPRLTWAAGAPRRGGVEIVNVAASNASRTGSTVCRLAATDVDSTPVIVVLTSDDDDVLTRHTPDETGIVPDLLSDQANRAARLELLAGNVCPQSVIDDNLVSDIEKVSHNRASLTSPVRLRQPLDDGRLADSLLH
jgi:hypothetical protein